MCILVSVYIPPKETSLIGCRTHPRGRGCDSVQCSVYTVDIDLEHLCLVFTLHLAVFPGGFCVVTTSSAF